MCEFKPETSEFKGVTFFFLFLWIKLCLLQAHNHWTEENFNLSHQATHRYSFCTMQIYWTYAVPGNWIRSSFFYPWLRQAWYFLVCVTCHTGEHLPMLSDLITAILDGLSEICLPDNWLRFSHHSLRFFVPLAFVIASPIPGLEEWIPPTARRCHYFYFYHSKHFDISGTNHIIPLNEPFLGGSGQRWC